jgi:hypothetical protein
LCLDPKAPQTSNPGIFHSFGSLLAERSSPDWLQDKGQLDDVKGLERKREL